MLDVDTNTYINLTHNIKNIEDKNYDINEKHNKIYTKGKLKIKENKNENDLNNFLLKNIQTMFNEKEVNSNKNVNENKILNNNKNENININLNEHNENDICIKKIHHQNNKSDFFINNRPNSNSINKEKKNNSNSIDKKAIFVQKDSKKKLKLLRDLIMKKIEHYQNKNPFYNNNQSNTINIIENIDNNYNKNKKKEKIKPNTNNDIVNKRIKLDIDKNNRNNTSRIMHNNSITII